MINCQLIPGLSDYNCSSSAFTYSSISGLNSIPVMTAQYYKLTGRER